MESTIKSPRTEEGIPAVSADRDHGQSSGVEEGFRPASTDPSDPSLSAETRVVQLPFKENSGFCIYLGEKTD
jgi:hypothetical protein